VSDDQAEDVLFDVDLVSCSQCGKALHPGFSDFTGDGDRVCRDCLTANSDMGVEDFSEGGEESLPDGVRRVFLYDKIYMRCCSYCGNWYEDGSGFKSVFGARLCRPCVRRLGLGAIFHPRMW